MLHCCPFPDFCFNFRHKNCKFATYTLTPSSMIFSTFPPKTFKESMIILSGSGRIRLHPASTSTGNRTGIRVSLDQLDLRDLDTKPFEPKLPLPEAFESDLVKTAISQVKSNNQQYGWHVFSPSFCLALQLQPIVNQYLSRKPLYLPDSIAPLAASPQLQVGQNFQSSSLLDS